MLKKSEFEKDIRSTGYYKNKTKNILSAAKMIKREFGGDVPNNMDDLLKIPGVGRKTANVILNNALGVAEGIVVDTHVRRLSIKFDLTDNKTPEKIEKDLMKILPKNIGIVFLSNSLNMVKKFVERENMAVRIIL